MSDVQFEEDNSMNMNNRFAMAAGEPPIMVKLLLKTGLVKDEKQANYVLIGIAAVSVLLTIWVVKSTFFGASTPVAPPSGFPTGAFPAPGQL